MYPYLTTPIYYASGSPHLGHVYTTVVADCFRRHQQFSGNDPLLVTGTDEHGDKILRKAAASGQAVEAFVADRHAEFAAVWRELNVPVDGFVRTTSDAHRTVVTDFWTRLVAAGAIYEGEYEGHYCFDCEQFQSDAEYCPVHRSRLENVKEPGYFFRLSAYQDRLLTHIREHEEFIYPQSRRNEVLAFLEDQPLRDLAVSRRNRGWGIPVPGDAGHVIYVWLDALVSYLSALGPLGSDVSRRRWPQATHFIGKDILIFHAVYWPALLWAAGFAPPQRLVVNGWLTVEGRKIAKSDPATVIDPLQVAAKVGHDGLKYYLLRGISLGSDLDYREEGLAQVINHELAGGLGNLVSRFSALFARSLPDGLQRSGPPGVNALATVAAAERIRAALDHFDLRAAGDEFVAAIRALNAAFQQDEPWHALPGRRDQLLQDYHDSIASLSVAAGVLVPGLGQGIRECLCLPELQCWDDSAAWCEHLTVTLAPPLQPRVA